jgi:hypothetical protein
LLEEHEKIIRSGQASLIADLNDEVAAINTLWEAFDDIELLPVDGDTVVLGGWTELSYPIVELASPDWLVRDLSLMNADGDFHTAVIVRVTASDPALEPGRLYVTMLRYTAAIVRVLLAPGAWNTDTRSVSIDPELGFSGEYGFDPRTRERQETLGESVMTFNLQAVADRT